MTKIFKDSWRASTLVLITAMVAFLTAMTPVLAFAQEAVETAADGGGGIALAPIIMIGSAVVSVLGAVIKFLPAGWKTYTNIAVGVANAVVAGLTDLAQTHPTATMSAIVLAMIGATIGRSKARPKQE